MAHASFLLVFDSVERLVEITTRLPSLNSDAEQFGVFPIFYLTTLDSQIAQPAAIVDRCLRLGVKRKTVKRTWDKLPTCQYLVQAMAKLRYRLTSWKPLYYPQFFR